VREICLVRLDKTRPALVLTREAARAAMTKVTIAPITTTIKGLSSGVLVGPVSPPPLNGSAPETLVDQLAPAYPAWEPDALYATFAAT